MAFRCGLLVAVGLGTAAFSMQDILLEPYGGEILHLSVGQTTTLTAILAAGTLIGLALASRWLARGFDPYRLAGVRRPARRLRLLRGDLRRTARSRCRCSSPARS